MKCKDSAYATKCFQINKIKKKHKNVFVILKKHKMFLQL